VNYVMELSSVALPDADRVGRKAAVLGALAHAGFPVPDGFVITAAALDSTLHAAGLDPADRAEVARRVNTIELPDDLMAELRSAADGFGEGPVAVRSSGAAEDLAGKSYAGQYESVLNVTGFDALVDAVRACWASGFSERLAAYDGAPTSPVSGLGVLVQRMVASVAAGVAFSVNPVTGDASETMVSAVRGLGDKLMAGEVSADEWSVRDGAASLTSGAGDAIDAADAVRVADLAQRVAAYFDAPQDVEWAIAGGDVRLLQARPITALRGAVEQIPIPVEPPDGFWVRDRTSGAPWTTMKTSVFLPIYRSVAAHVFAFTNGSVPRLSTIGGWVYLSTPPDTMRDLAARMERIAAEVAAGGPRALVDRWNREWKPEFAARIACLRDVTLAEMTLEELEKHTGELNRLFAELHDVYFRLTGAAVELLGQLGVVCEDLLGWTPPQTLRLRGGLRGDHMAATVRLGELAALAAQRPEIERFLESDDGGDAAWLAGIDPEFAEAFDDYVRRYAHRTIGFDITEPTLAEQPSTLLNLIRAQLRQPYDFAAERAALAARQEEALAEARAVLAGRSEAERAIFETAYADSEAASPVRDEKVFYAVSLWALLRHATLELGARLAAGGAVDAAEDAFFLELDEALGALQGPGGGDLRSAVRRRRGEHAWAAAHPGPQFYGAFPGPPAPDPDVSPSPAAMRAFRVGQWSMSLWSGGAREDAGDGSLAGVAASAGRYTGPVRVIRDVTEFGKLRRGDVLVCPETTAQWSVLFPSVGALVTDHGSLLSHPAIIAREYGVPAVVATGRATELFRDDRLVTVDGTAGVVRPAT
jgi:rifampicin phosphotransferase